jgi:hypothetical protein
MPLALLVIVEVSPVGILGAVVSTTKPLFGFTAPDVIGLADTLPNLSTAYTL